MQCGAFTSTDRVVGLARPCPGRVTTIGAGVRLRRLKARLHPTLRLPTTPPVRVCSGAVPLADQDFGGGREGAAEERPGCVADLAPSHMLRLGRSA